MRKIISLLPLYLFIVALLSPLEGRAQLLGPVWPRGSSVEMRLALGSPGSRLQDGSTSWNAVAADALNFWSGYMDFITVSSVSSPTVAKSSGDGINAVFFSNTIFGDSFDEGTLAVTVYRTKPGTHVETEADVIVNNADHYDSYRGVQQVGAIDLKRVLFHEFGHVFGLDHNTDQSLSIMNPVISNVDHPMPVDTGLVKGLYAGLLNGPGKVTWRANVPYSGNVLPNNSPTSFTTTNLPPGIVCNWKTRFKGTPTLPGDYAGTITSQGPVTDVSDGFQFNALGVDQVPGLLGIIPAYYPTQIIPDPVRPRVYYSYDAGVGMIDTDTLQATSLIDGLNTRPYISLSADNSTLMYTISYNPQEYRVDLDSLTSLPSIPIPSAQSQILEGLNSQFYMQTATNLVQLNAAGGVVHNFAYMSSVEYGGAQQFVISPDRKTLYLARQGTGIHNSGGELSSWDISGPVPVLIQRILGSHPRVSISDDGKYLYTIVGENLASPEPANGTAVRCLLPALTGTTFASSPFLNAPAEAPDGTIFQAVAAASTFQGFSGDFWVYSPVTLKKIGTLQIPNLRADLEPDSPQGMAFDHTGKYMFAAVENGNSDADGVWIFSTNYASYPQPFRGDNTLANISTRARVESGEDAMIAGFIIQGTQPKKVLIRGLGPSLPITGALSNPILTLYDSTGKVLATNDSWISNKLTVLSSLLAPDNKRESAISITLAPGAYTAIVRDVSGQPGLALVEVYDQDPKDALLANISTRGKVGTSENVMIGGFIVGGTESTKVLVRALGPSLAGKGVSKPLTDPVLEIHDSKGKIVSSNDNWKATQQSAIQATGLAPTKDEESAIVTTLAPGAYTAVVRGENGGTGVALVEVYNLDGSVPAIR